MKLLLLNVADNLYLSYQEDQHLVQSVYLSGKHVSNLSLALSW